jgi:hypothetical protein
LQKTEKFSIFAAVNNITGKVSPRTFSKKDDTMAILKGHESDSDAVKIEHDRQKTKRYQMYIGAITLLALVGVYVIFKSGNGKLDVNVKEGKFGLSIDKPIVSQENVATKNYESPKGTIQFTTGRISQNLISQFESENISFSPDRFTGKNFVNKELGFLFSIEHPEKWKVVYSPNNFVLGAYRVNDFFSADGNNMNVSIATLPSPIDITSYAEECVQELIQTKITNQIPNVEYDVASNTVFFVYFNNINGSYTFQKAILSGNKAFVASANLSATSNDQIAQEDMGLMVRSFTLIGS